eukprot:s449_g21.t1
MNTTTSTLHDRLSRLDAQASFQELHLDTAELGLPTALPALHGRRVRVWLKNGTFTPNSLAQCLQQCYHDLLAKARQDKVYLEDLSVLPNFAGEGRCRMESGLQEHVAVGGTFDRLHQGHKVLLSCAAAIATKGLVVGISGEPLLRDKAAARYLQSWGERARAVAAFLALQRPDLTLRLEELWDAFGPSLWPQLGALVVSAETEAGGHAVNEHRRALQRRPVQLLVVPLVQSNQGEKLSSSALRLEDELQLAFWRCWKRSKIDEGTRWSKLLPPLAKMAGERLSERPEECRRQLHRLMAPGTPEMALARCLEFLFVVAGSELLDVMAKDLAFDAATEWPFLWLSRIVCDGSSTSRACDAIENVAVAPRQTAGELEPVTSPPIWIAVRQQEDETDSFGQKLSVLKFLGTAVPIAMQDPELPAERLRDLCRLAVQKKLPRPGVEALISQDLSSPEEEELKLLENLAGQTGPAVAIWVCNGRRIDLQAGGQAISARDLEFDGSAINTDDFNREPGSQDCSIVALAQPSRKTA